MNVAPSARHIADAYGRGAEEYAAVLEPTLGPVIEAMLALATVSSEDDVLDLATGTGIIARTVADRGAAVVGVDFAPGMLEVACKLSPACCGFVAADAMALPIAGNSVDLVTCGLSLSHFTDISSALAEVRRVLRPGGRLVASGWAASGSNPAFAVSLAALRRHTAGAIHPFAELLDERTWAGTQSGCEVLRHAGFASVRATTSRLLGKYSTAEDAYRWVFAWPSYGRTLRNLDDTARAAVRAEATREIARTGKLDWQQTYNCFLAVKPTD